ncbi:hypothetical protein D3C78_1469640 [compost metagenome]
MLLVKHPLKAEHHIVGVHFAGGLEPGGGLERHIPAQVETVGSAIVQHFPAFRQFRDQAVSVGVDIQ